MLINSYADDITLHFSTSYNRRPTPQKWSDSMRDAIGRLPSDFSLVSDWDRAKLALFNASKTQFLQLFIRHNLPDNYPLFLNSSGTLFLCFFSPAYAFTFFFQKRSSRGLAFGHAYLETWIRFLDICRPLFFGITAKWPKITQNCCHRLSSNGTCKVIRICGSAAISLLHSSSEKTWESWASHSSSEKTWESWAITKKSKPEATNGRKPMIKTKSLHQYLPAPKVYHVEKNKIKNSCTLSHWIAI